eukprot:TRINITY_DN5323_c0_g1_i2.p1 TRINITY_DN5323_c0_g1~~TRINITY_DN5323_c0_g1_i2.p1  ORF type:complete len:120 (+),score=7.37 TRINITY_DN5323_c0_g1_i2:203-562(+)
MFSPNSFATRFNSLKPMVPLLSISKSLNAFLISSSGSLSSYRQSPPYHLDLHEVSKVLVIDLPRAFAVSLCHHPLYLVLRRFKSQRAHCYLKLFGIYRAGAVSVEEIEGFFDFLPLLFG